MAASPANIVRRMGGSSMVNGDQAKLRDVRRAFVNAGYGSTKAMKWITLYLEEGILEEVTRDSAGDMLVRSDWWLI